MFTDLFFRLRALFRRQQVESELDDELRFHFEQQVEKYVSAGANREEANRRARLVFGGTEQLKEECRDARGTRWLEDLVQDFRYAVRTLRQRPGFATVVLLTLALGVGATTVMFSLINGVLLKPLPYPQTDRLVAVHGHTDTWNAEIYGEQNVAYPDFVDCQRESRSLEMAGVLYNGGTVSEPGDPEYVDLREISSGVFSVLRVNLAQGRAFLPEEDRSGARRVPGAQSVAAVDTVPMREGNNQIGYWPTADVPPANKQPMALATCVTPEYLKVMGIPLRRGRFFDDRDRMGSELVIVIDDVLAQNAFGGEDPVGKRLWMPDMGYGPFVVTGVVGHVRHWGLAGDDQAQVRAQFYYPFAQLPDKFARRWSELMSVAVRTSVAPLSLVESLRREVRGATGDQVLYEVRTMEQLASSTLDQHRFLLLLFGVFAGLALLLACIGIYGALAYLTGQRVPEIGVRIALGATARGVVWLVLRHSLVMIFGGVAAGIIAALAAARVLERSVAGVRSVEPLAFTIMMAILVVAGLFASWLPARRASKVDPIVALRYE